MRPEHLGIPKAKGGLNILLYKHATYSITLRKYILSPFLKLQSKHAFAMYLYARVQHKAKSFLKLFHHSKGTADEIQNEKSIVASR